MKSRTTLWTILLLFISFSAVKAQKTHVPAFIEWNEITNSIKFGSKFSIYTEVQFRFVYNNNLFQTLQHQFRVGLEFHVDKHFSIQPLAYVYTVNGAYELNPKPYGNNEHRVYSQMSYKHHVGRFHIQHRLRYEWRFAQTNSLDSLGAVVYDNTYTNYKNRIRYRLSANIALTKKDIEPNTLYLRVWDELMMGFGDPIRYPTYKIEDNIQNRVFVGVGYQVTKPISISLGILYQMQMKSNGTYVEHNVGPFLSVNFSPDLTNILNKKKAEEH